MASLDTDTLSALLVERLGEADAAHCERVARTAVDLALVYGVDTDHARLAGLLHDWDRHLDDDQLLAVAAEEGMTPTPSDTASPRILHARTAAARLVRDLPGVPPEVVRAVELHTLGDVRMEPLDMVVYVADMIEPGRAYKGVDDLREAAGTLSLEALFAEAYRHSVMHIVRKRKPLHPLTVDVWNAHVARSRS